MQKASPSQLWTYQCQIFSNSFRFKCSKVWIVCGRQVKTFSYSFIYVTNFWMANESFENQCLLQECFPQVWITWLHVIPLVFFLGGGLISTPAGCTTLSNPTVATQPDSTSGETLQVVFTSFKQCDTMYFTIKRPLNSSPL